jgi:hypothetical protein
VPSGTELSTYSGPCTITERGVVIDAKIVECGPLLIRAADVTITRSKLIGGVLIDADWPNPYSFTVSDSEIDALDTRAALFNGNRGVGKNNFTVERTNIHGGLSSAWCEYACTIRDSWLHDQGADRWGCVSNTGRKHTCLHQSGIRIGSGPADKGQLVEHNTIVCDAPFVPDANPPGTDASGCSASVTGYGDFAPIRNNRVHRNLFPGSAGGTCVYGGSTAGKPHSDGATGNVFTENVFTVRADVPKCGFYFSSADFDASAPGNRWSGNRLWDGETFVELQPNS